MAHPLFSDAIFDFAPPDAADTMMMMPFIFIVD